MEEEKITQTIQFPVNIKLSKGKGRFKEEYGWEIRLLGDDINEVIKVLEETDKILRDKFSK